MTHRSEPLHFVVPGPLDQVTGGYRYDARIVAGLRALGRQVVVHELRGRFPIADTTSRAAAAAALQTIGDAPAVIDGLALPALADGLVDSERIVALVHHPLWLETGLSADRRRRLRRAEATTLRKLAGVIVTSRRTARDVASLGVSLGRIAIVEPATDRAPAPARRHRRAPRLLAVGMLTPRKGHRVLWHALAACRRLTWRLDCVGSLSRDLPHAARLKAELRLCRLARRVRLVGELTGQRLERAYRQADLFVLPSFHEGYGMAFAEAMMSGLPVVATRAGALPDVVSRRAGILVRVGDARGLARTLRRLLSSSRVRRRLADGARHASRRFPGQETVTQRFTAVLSRFIG